MHKTFTTLFWTYRNFTDYTIDELISYDEDAEVSRFFIKVIDELEAKAPEITEDLLQEIISQAS